MMRKKVFTASDISIVEVVINDQMPSHHIEDLIKNPVVRFPENPTGRISYSFAKWYGVGIDLITYVCQVQILRFLAHQDATIEVSSICSVSAAFNKFFEYLTLRSTALARDLAPCDINRDLINGYIRHLSISGLEITGQRVNFSLVKTALLAMGRREIFTLIAHGNDKTFPLNPFPNANRHAKGAVSLTRQVRQNVSVALKKAVQPVWSSDQPLTSELLAYCVLIVALHTGRNTIPLLEMNPDCLRPHPKDNMSFLVLWKRRGHNTNKVVLRSESEGQKSLESMPSIKVNVERLIRHIISRTETIRAAHPEYKDRVWIYHSRETSNLGLLRTLKPVMLEAAIKKLVADYELKDSDGSPLRLNVSRLRKTFANRVFEIVDGDIASTARALGNTPRVTDTNYLAVTAESKKNWRFMGEILVNELLTQTIGATFHMTPIAKCSDNRSGRFVQQREGAVCTSFINCLRCSHFVITADDLYKLFSFYFRIYSERAHMTKQRWTRDFSHIPRLIDDYVVAEGLRRGVFKQSAIDEAKARARAAPHPFWSADTIPSLEMFA